MMNNVGVVALCKSACRDVIDGKKGLEQKRVRQVKWVKFFAFEYQYPYTR